MKQSHDKWLRIASGAAGCYAVAVPVLLVAMAMEPTPQLLQNAAWLLAIIGLLVFSAVMARLRFLRRIDPEMLKGSVHARSLGPERLRGFAFIASACLALFVLCGLVWVFAARSQCLIQEWVLGHIVAVGCRG